MKPIYVGIDVAGAANTWMAALSPRGDGLEVVAGPRTSSLQEIVCYCEENDVVAVAIDAQLTMALSENSGFRESDLHLRRMLPYECRTWVASLNSLMAVPARGRLLADSLAPIVGTLLETHPRVSLLFGVDKAVSMAVRHYKKGPSAEAHVATLWRHWSGRFHIACDEVPQNDGALDALVCATVAYLYHSAPDMLLRLRHKTPEKTGRGPFYVLMPIPESEVRIDDDPVYRCL